MTITGTTIEPCGRYLRGLPARRCTAARCEYRAYSYSERDEDGNRWTQYRAERRCVECGGSSAVDVAFEVPRVVKTAEQWAAWWHAVDNREV